MQTRSRTRGEGGMMNLEHISEVLLQEQLKVYRNRQDIDCYKEYCRAFLSFPRIETVVSHGMLIEDALLDFYQLHSLLYVKSLVDKRSIRKNINLSYLVRIGL
jgi:type II secretory pathway predicted ATPase ExeA